MSAPKKPARKPREFRAWVGPNPGEIDMHRRMLRAITRALEHVGTDNLGHWQPRALATWIAPSVTRVAMRALNPQRAPKARRK